MELNYIQTYNILGSVVCTVALASSLAHWCSGDSRYLLAAAMCQSFFLIEILNINMRKSNARFLPTVLQLLSRMFITWVIFWYLGIVNRTYPVITSCWYTADLIRYLFYACRAPAIGFIRYNFFILAYPVGVSLEMYCMVLVYKRLSAIPSYIFALFMAGYSVGFAFLFLHMLKQRRWYGRRRVKSRRKED
jgi:very-long-chain (3R)-3-hydroxyacyl-CoA dehydratase